VEQVARAIVQKVGVPQKVAILLPRTSPDAYIAQIAVLKAGGAYTCLEPTFPDSQIAQIFEDAEPTLILTNTSGRARLQTANLLSLPCLLASEAIQAESPPCPPLSITPQSLAYMIYTSGTTGRPKGVMISHESICNLVVGDLTEFRLGVGDRVVQGSSTAYDSSVEEIWLALASGATLVIMDDETARLGPDLVTWLQSERITVFCPPPTLLRATGCENPQKALPDLRLLYVGGEALPNDVVEKWAVGRRLVNGYGPTECTVTATRSDVLIGEPVTIGKPVPGNTAWVVDENLNELPLGMAGELVIGGVGVAIGYHNRPELNAEKFPTHPRFGRVYRTGDRVERDENGDLLYHGRIDAQVKLRGYRIELEAIEAVLARCEGVREAVCTVQGEGALQTLVAFIISTEVTHPPDFEELRKAIQQALPSYMVPARIGVLEEIPKSVGGKVKRSALPLLKATPTETQTRTLPRYEAEEWIEAAMRQILVMTEPLSVTDDFFYDMGGTSLLAAQCISLLRANPHTASLTVRDLYEARTIEALARKLKAKGAVHATRLQEPKQNYKEPYGATVIQGVWLLLELLVASWAGYANIFWLIPFLYERLGLVLLVLLAPLLGILGACLYFPLALGVAVLVKRLLIGKYYPCREPAYGSLYLRNWMVGQVLRLIPFSLLAGTEFQCMALRALGARIGKRVHIHRGVNLFEGGWDLLEIGDDVTLNQDVSLRLVDFEEGHIVIGAIKIGDRATLETRAGMGYDTHLGADSRLTALSYLPSGERLGAGEVGMGIPAHSVGVNSPPPTLQNAKELSPLAYGVLLLLSQSLLWWLMALPLELGFLVLAHYSQGRIEPFLTTFSGQIDYQTLLAVAAVVTLPLPLAVVLEAIMARALGRVSEGVIGQWSPEYIRVWLKTLLVDSASHWLSGTLFWPLWLRLAGMQVGKNCEISTIIDVVPELVEIDSTTFFADGIYLGGALLDRGTATLAKVRLSANTFLGNHAVIPAGTTLPSDILIGVAAVADEKQIRPGSSWFGHPLFELPRREVVECDISLTHNPSPLRWFNRFLWEAGRFLIPIPSALAFCGWLSGMTWAEASLSPPLFWSVGVPVVSLLMLSSLCLLLLLSKWLLLGRVKPGTHPLWSCWCSRWDFLYVAWGDWARGTLNLLEGTLFLTWYLRLVGMKIGRGVVLGRGFSQVVDPDMLEFGDGSTVSAMFQAHTFEDRVLKIDKVLVRSGATLGVASIPLYGADIGENALVEPFSVVMKHERLLPSVHYEGAPTHPRTAAASLEPKADALST
jgi:non-ribosomal peptide synthetase-like protein